MLLVDGHPARQRALSLRRRVPCLTLARRAPSLLRGLERGSVLRLVDADFTAARQREARDGAPTLFVDRRALDALRRHRLNERVDVIAHQVQLVRAVAVGRVYGDLSRWQGEDQPAVSGVGEWIAQNITKERAIGLCVFAVDDDVSAVDHVAYCAPFSCVINPGSVRCFSDTAYGCPALEKTLGFFMLVTISMRARERMNA